MFKVRSADERGRGKSSIHQVHYSFSYADYKDPSYESFESMRAINATLIEPEQELKLDHLLNVECMLLVLDGSIVFKLNQDQALKMRPFDWTFYSYTEGMDIRIINPTKKKIRIYQIMFDPFKPGGPNNKIQLFHLEHKLAHKEIYLFASDEGRKGSLKVNINASFYFTSFKKNDFFSYNSSESRPMVTSA